MAEHYDDLETRSADARAASLAECLPRQIAHAKANSAHFGRALADVDPAAVTGREALAGPAGAPQIRPDGAAERRPAARRPQRHAGRKAGPAVHVAGADLRAGGPRPGRLPLRARAVRRRFPQGELVHNTFAYHLTPAGRIAESGAHALGCPVFPAGVGNTEQQVQAIAGLKPSNYIGTPSFLRIILEKARETGADVSSLKRGLVSGEALPPSLRAELLEHGVAVLQAYATADLGLIAYESHAKEGLIADEGAIVEIVRPGTGSPVADGEVGEVVVTVMNPDYPLVRFGTGDLSAVLPGISPCGRTNLRIRGWMGRADQTTKIKGMFVHPAQVAEVARRHAEIARARLEVTGAKGQDSMTLVCEAAGSPEGLAEAVAASLSAVTKLRGAVRLVAPGELPNDGKVIADLEELRVAGPSPRGFRLRPACGGPVRNDDREGNAPPAAEHARPQSRRKWERASNRRMPRLALHPHSSFRPRRAARAERIEPEATRRRPAARPFGMTTEKGGPPTAARRGWPPPQLAPTPTSSFRPRRAA